MAGNLKVTFQELQDASTQLSNGSNDIENILTALRTRLDPIHASWEGAAKVEFDKMWANWSNSSKSLLESLDGIASLLKTAAQSYSDAETQIKSGFAQNS